MNAWLRRCRLLAVLPLLLLPALAPLNQPFYPEIPDVETKLKNLETAYPTMVKRVRIGTSTVENRDIYALKISSNVDRQQDKPVWLFVGVIHGNEHMGLKVVMDLAGKLTGEYRTNPDVRKWVDAYDIWLVPYMNPVGYQHRVRGNRPVGGVDLNRNYDFHWANGQPKPDASDYRGTAPFSESETQAMRALYRDIQPWFGITFHHGTGQDGGLIFYPWSSSKGGFNPDRDALRDFAQRYANAAFASRSKGKFCEPVGGGRYALEDPEGEPCGDKQTAQYCRKLCWKPQLSTQGILGQASNWNYAAVGTMDVVVEMTDRAFYLPFMREARGPENEREQATLDIAKEFSRNYLDGIETMFDEFLNPSRSNDAYRASGVTGHVLDKVTKAPIVARVEFQGYASPEIEGRYSNKQFGRFWRFLPNGKHTIWVSAPGYKTHTQQFRLSTNAMKSMRILLEKDS